MISRLFEFPHQKTKFKELKALLKSNKTKQNKNLLTFSHKKTKQIKMNPVIAKPVVIVASEVTEKPLEPTNQCSIM